MLIQTILGSWDRTSPLGRNAASKLAQEVCEHELAHSFMTFNTCYKDTGLFGIYLVCPDNKLDDAMWYTPDNLVRLCHNVTDEEVARAKTQLKANMLMQLDSFSQTTMTTTTVVTNPTVTTTTVTTVVTYPIITTTTTTIVVT